jgi:hypothetical protein
MKSLKSVAPDGVVLMHCETHAVSPSPQRAAVHLTMATQALSIEQSLSGMQQLAPVVDAAPVSMHSSHCDDVAPRNVPAFPHAPVDVVVVVVVPESSAPPDPPADPAPPAPGCTEHRASLPPWQSGKGGGRALVLEHATTIKHQALQAHEPNRLLRFITPIGGPWRGPLSRKRAAGTGTPPARPTRPT